MFITAKSLSNSFLNPQFTSMIFTVIDRRVSILNHKQDLHCSLNKNIVLSSFKGKVKKKTQTELSIFNLFFQFKFVCTREARKCVFVTIFSSFEVFLLKLDITFSFKLLCFSYYEGKELKINHSTEH